MPTLDSAGVSAFDFLSDSILNVLRRRSIFAEDTTAIERQILVNVGLENATTVTFVQQAAFNPFDPSIGLPDLQVTSRFTYGGEACDGLMLAIAQQGLVGGYVAVRAEHDGEPVDPDLSIDRKKITDAGWNTFIRTPAPPAGFVADLTLYLWLPDVAGAARWASLELDMMVPSGTGRAGLTAPGRSEADAFGRIAGAHDLQCVGVTKLALD